MLYLSNFTCNFLEEAIRCLNQQAQIGETTKFRAKQRLSARDQNCLTRVF